MPKRKATQSPDDDENAEKKQKTSTGGAYPLTIAVKKGKRYFSDSKAEELVLDLLLKKFRLRKNLVYQNRFYKELECTKTGCDCAKPLQLDIWIPKFKVGIEISGSPHRVFADFKSFEKDTTKTDDQIKEKFNRYQFHDKFKSEKMADMKLTLISADFGMDINVSRQQMCDSVQAQLLTIPEFKSFVDKKQIRKKPVPKHIKEEKEKARKHQEWVNSLVRG